MATEEKIRNILLKYYYGKEAVETYDKNREMVIVPITAGHGQTSAVVISMNGSPPKGSAIIHNLYYSNTEAIIFGRSKIRKYMRGESPKSTAMVELFLDFLKEKGVVSS